MPSGMRQKSAVHFAGVGRGASVVEEGDARAEVEEEGAGGAGAGCGWVDIFFVVRNSARHHIFPNCYAR